MKSVATRRRGRPSRADRSARERKSPLRARLQPKNPVTILCQPMPDELAIGHLGRIMWLNGFPTLGTLSTRLNGSEQAEGHTGQEAFRSLLCAATGTDADTYGRRHSLNLFMRNVEHRFSIPVSSLLSHTFRGQIERARQKKLRCCVPCMESDIEAHGFSWFRRIHQLTGIDWCVLHGAELHEVDDSSSYSACPHVWQKRGQLHPCGTEWERLELTPAFVRRFVYAFLALSNHPTPVDGEALHGVVHKSVIRDAPPLAAASRLLFKRLQALAPPGWLDSHDFFERIRQNALRTAISEVARPSAYAQQNATYALALATLPATDWSKFNRLLGPTRVVPNISVA